MMKNKSSYRKYLWMAKSIVTILLIFYLVYKIDIVESIKLFKRVNLLLLIPLILYLPSLILRTLRWKTILNINISFVRLLKLSWVSNFFSNFLPSTIAGDSYKVIKLRKELGIRNIIESIFFDRLSGLIGMIIVAAIFSYDIYNVTNSLYLLIAPIILLLLAIMGFFFVLSFNINLKYYNYIRKTVLEFKNRLVSTTIISLIYIALGAISFWVYYLMFDVSLNFLTVLTLYTLTELISFIPISINALGLREGSMVYLFSLIGVSSEISLAIAIISRLVMLLQTSIGGLIYLFEK